MALSDHERIEAVQGAAAGGAGAHDIIRLVAFHLGQIFFGQFANYVYVAAGHTGQAAALLPFGNDHGTAEVAEQGQRGLSRLRIDKVGHAADEEDNPRLSRFARYYFRVTIKK